MIEGQERQKEIQDRNSNVCVEFLKPGTTVKIKDRRVVKKKLDPKYHGIYLRRKF
jgi:hypothetical protein